MTENEEEFYKPTGEELEIALEFFGSVLVMEEDDIKATREILALRTENKRLKIVLPDKTFGSEDVTTATEDYWNARKAQSDIGFGPAYKLADVVRELFNNWQDALKQNDKKSIQRAAFARGWKANGPEWGLAEDAAKIAYPEDV